MLQQIPISQITGYEDFEPRKALVRSMQDRGFSIEFPVVLQPEGDLYRVRDGRRRVAAAKAASLETVWAVVSENADETLTIWAHATRSENPVAELRAYQALQKRGLSDEEIARRGYASLQRIRKIAKLNHLIPEIARRVDKGEIAAGVAFQIASLAPEVQRELAQEDAITAPVVRRYKEVSRKQATLSVEGLENLFDIPPAATAEEMLASLSTETLNAILDDLPDDDRFAVWRGKVRRALQARVAAPVTVFPNE